MNDLNERMLAAHAASDLDVLIELYTEAADASNDADASCFYLVHAYVFALEAGASQAPALHARLVDLGREE